MAGSASRRTSPPSPPSPPSGPPRGTNFSRRKLTHPAPPSPPLTKTSISSTNISVTGKAGEASDWVSSGGQVGAANEVVVALALEAHVSVGLGEEGVVDADPDVDPCLEARAALANQNASRCHELAAEPLDPEHLGIGVTAVSRTAHAL